MKAMQQIKIALALCAAVVVAGTLYNPTEYVKAVTEECDGGNKVEPGPFTYSAPSGQVVTKVCVKSGTSVYYFTANGDDGCYAISGINTQNASAVKIGDGRSCQDISHANFYTAVESSPTPTLTPTATPSPTPSVTPTPTPVDECGEECDPTPTPTMTPVPTTPPNIGGPGDGRSDGKSDGGSSCPECTQAPIGGGQILGASTEGQVLGASTDYAATGGTVDMLMNVLGSIGAFSTAFGMALIAKKKAHI